MEKTISDVTILKQDKMFYQEKNFIWDYENILNYMLTKSMKNNLKIFKVKTQPNIYQTCEN